MLLEEQPEGMGKGLKRVLMIVGVLALIAAIAGIVMSFMTEGKSKKRTVIQQIAVLRPPPPPPPPKPEEKPPEPEIEKEEVKMPEPDTPPEPQQADAPPASQDLGVDAQGTGNGDSFGLVGKPGGKDITTIGGGGGDRAQFSFFAGSMQRYFAEQFNRNEKLKSRDYRVVIKVWLGADGRVQKFEIAGSSGNEETDAAIRLALSRMAPLPEPPPANMPQPVRLRMTSRGAG